MKQLKTAIMFAVAAVTACSIRICQLMFMTDPATGFFYPRYETLGTVLTVLYMVVLAATAVIAFWEMRGSVKKTVRSVPGVIFLALAGVFTAANISSVIASGARPLLMLFQLVLTVGCAAFLFIEAVRGLPKVELPSSIRPWLSLFPVCFWLVETVTAFSHYMTIANISENIFDLAAMCFLTLFFLLYGKEINGVDTKWSVRLIVPVGLCTSILCLLCSVPRFVADIFGVETIHGTEPKIIYIAMAAAIIFLLPRRISAKNN